MLHSSAESLRMVGMQDVEDEVLVRRVSEPGNGEQALSELYDRYVGLVYGTGMRYLRDRTLAEDLVQDVFTSIWRNAGTFDPSKASFSTWIHRITRNRATDLIRRRKVRVKTVGSDRTPEPEESDPTGDLSRSFDVASYLAQLTPKHREVLTLAYMEGLSQREIARRTDTPLGTIKSRTSSALRALRETMLQEENWWPDGE
ncbi:MAG: sigma-70 family RNA polymerase sigma factor [Rubrobacteraceae bacterium]